MQRRSGVQTGPLVRDRQLKFVLRENLGHSNEENNYHASLNWEKYLEKSYSSRNFRTDTADGALSP